MECKKCGNPIDESAVYCKSCGRKVKSTSSKKRNVFIFFAITILVVLIGLVLTSIFMLLTKDDAIDVVKNIFVKENTAEEIANEDAQSENGDGKVGITTPPFTEEINYEIGFLGTECITKEKIYFTSLTGDTIYSTNLTTNETVIEHEKDINKFFISENKLIFSNDEGVFVKPNNTTRETKLVDDPNVYEVLVTDEFVYYTKKMAAGDFNIYRVNIEDNVNVTIKENVISYYFDTYNMEIYYATIIKSSDYDERNNFLPFATISDDIETDSEITNDFLTILKCDGTGLSDVKIAEYEIKEGETPYIGNIFGKNDVLVFNFYNANDKKYYIIRDGKVIDVSFGEIADLFFYGQDIIFTTPDANLPYVYKIKRYDKDSNADAITELSKTFNYKSIHVAENTIYVLVDNQKILKMDFDGNNFKGFFMYFSDYATDLGAILKTDHKNMYLSNAYINLDGKDVAFLDRKTGEVNKKEDIAPFAYISDQDWITLYFDWLSKSEYISQNLVFGLSDFDNDNIAELILATRNDLLAYNTVFEGAKNIQVYKIGDGKVVELDVKRTEPDDTETISSIYKYGTENGFLIVDDANQSNIMTLFTFDEESNIIKTPKLKVDFSNGTKYYRFEGADYSEEAEINYNEYNKIYTEIIRELKFVGKYNLNISEITEGLYFNNYLEPSEFR